MFGKLFSDRASVPELDQFMEQDIDRMQAELAAGLAAGFAARGRQAERLNALIRLALDFWTWRRLSREGLDDEAAAELMAAATAAGLAVDPPVVEEAPVRTSTQGAPTIR
jgi:hypothetical protein